MGKSVDKAGVSVVEDSKLAKSSLMKECNHSGDDIGWIRGYFKAVANLLRDKGKVTSAVRNLFEKGGDAGQADGDDVALFRSYGLIEEIVRRQEESDDLDFIHNFYSEWPEGAGIYSVKGNRKTGEVVSGKRDLPRTGNRSVDASWFEFKVVAMDSDEVIKNVRIYMSHPGAKFGGVTYIKFGIASNVGTVINLA